MKTFTVRRHVISPLNAILPIVFIAFFTDAVPAQALSPQSILSTMHKACDYQLSRGVAGKGWSQSTLYTGVLAMYYASKDEVYVHKTLDWAAANGWKAGLRNPDKHACIQVYTELYLLDPKQSNEYMIESGMNVFDHIIENNPPGHEFWWWIDALYMSPPGFVRMAKITGAEKYLDQMDLMWWDVCDHLYDPEEHLFYRDNSYIDMRTENGYKVFWSRGNGWVFAGLTRVLSCMPLDYPSRDRYVRLYTEMADKLTSIQCADGIWRSSLLDSAEFPTPETSGTSFYIFGLAWGINNGLLDKNEFAPVVENGWRALTRYVSDDGKLGYVQGVSSKPENSKADNTNPYAVGGFLQAGMELFVMNGGSVDLPVVVKGGSAVERAKSAHTNKPRLVLTGLNGSIRRERFTRYRNHYSMNGKLLRLADRNGFHYRITRVNQ